MTQKCQHNVTCWLGLFDPNQLEMVPDVQKYALHSLGSSTGGCACILLEHTNLKLTHCGLVTPSRDKNLLDATWTYVDLSLMWICVTPREKFHRNCSWWRIHQFSLKVILIKQSLNVLGANELNLITMDSSVMTTSLWRQSNAFLTMRLYFETRDNCSSTSTVLLTLYSFWWQKNVVYTTSLCRSDDVLWQLWRKVLFVLDGTAWQPSIT